MIRVLSIFLLFMSLEQSFAIDHYQDADGKLYPELNFIWHSLHDYFAEATPEKIGIIFWDKPVSMFDPDSMTIELNTWMFQNGRDAVVAHESSHLGLYQLSQGASIETSFRFFDEGFAEIMSARICSAESGYKRIALCKAIHQRRMNNVSFEKIQDWYQYCDSSLMVRMSPKLCYSVGSSFDYFIIEKYGESALRDFFVDIGKTRNLEISFQSIFHSSKIIIEKEWLNYLERKDSQIHCQLETPQVVNAYPQFDQRNVSSDVSEIYISFSEEMDNNVCLGTECGDTGICYDHAYWKDSKTLAIKVSKSLLPHYQYRISLGLAGRCALNSVLGIPFPVTVWGFQTY